MVTLLPTILAALSVSGGRSTASRAWELKQRLAIGDRGPLLTGTIARLEWVKATFGPKIHEQVSAVVVAGGFNPRSMAWQAIDRVIPWVATELQRPSPAPFSVEAWVRIDEIVDWATAAEVNLSRYRLEDALQASADWHGAAVEGGEDWRWADRLARVHRAIRVGEAPRSAEVVLSFPDGFTMVDLVSLEDMVFETSIMGHCVGRSDQYIDVVKSGHGRILSLRDALGWPILTFQSYEERGGAVDFKQVKGPHNAEVPPTLSRYVHGAYAELNKDVFDRYVARVDAALAKRLVALESDLGRFKETPLPDRWLLRSFPGVWGLVGPDLEILGVSETHRYEFRWIDLNKGSSSLNYHSIEIVYDPQDRPRAAFFFRAGYSWSKPEGVSDEENRAQEDLEGIGGGVVDFEARPYVALAAATWTPLRGVLPPQGDRFRSGDRAHTAVDGWQNTVLPWFRRDLPGFEENVLRSAERALAYAIFADLGSSPDTRAAALSTGSIGGMSRAAIALSWAESVARTPESDTIALCLTSEVTLQSLVQAFPSLLQSNTEVREAVFSTPDVLWSLLGVKARQHELGDSGRRGRSWTVKFRAWASDSINTLPLWRDPAVRRRVIASPRGAIAYLFLFDDGPREDTLRAVLSSPKEALIYWQQIGDTLLADDPRLLEAIARGPEWKEAWLVLGYPFASASPRKGESGWRIGSMQDDAARATYARIRPLLVDDVRFRPRKAAQRVEWDRQLRAWLQDPAPSDWKVFRAPDPENPVEHPVVVEPDIRPAFEWVRSIVPSAFPLAMSAPWFPAELADLPAVPSRGPVESTTSGLPEVAAFAMLGHPIFSAENRRTAASSALVLPPIDSVESLSWSGGDPSRPGDPTGAASVFEVWAWWTSLSDAQRKDVLRRMKLDAKDSMGPSAVNVPGNAARAARWHEAMPMRPEWPGVVPPWTRPGSALALPSSPADLVSRVSLLWVGLTPVDACGHTQTREALVLPLKKLGLYGAFPWRARHGHAGYCLVFPASVPQLLTHQCIGSVSKAS